MYSIDILEELTTDYSNVICFYVLKTGKVVVITWKMGDLGMK